MQRLTENLAMTTTTFTTPRDLLRFAVTRFNGAKLFFGHGSAEALDEAAYLILHTLKLPLDKLDPFLDARLLPDEVLQVLAVIERRAVERVPAAYITNEAWLGSYNFYVDERVIVPRSFIAELLHEQLVPWIENPDEVTRALDLCTGSGCLAILAALAFPDAQVDAADLSGDALGVAARNVADYGLADRIELIESDLFAALQGRRYDVVLSNPPYVNAESVAALPPEYQAEPALALGSGEDGLDATRQILAAAKSHLNPGGLLVVEIGHNRDVLEAVYPALPFTWLDTEGGEQFVFMLRREDLP